MQFCDVVRAPLVAALSLQSRLWPLPIASAGAAPADGLIAVSDFFRDEHQISIHLRRQSAITPGLDRKAEAAYLVGEYATAISKVIAVPLLALDILPKLDASNCLVGFDFPSAGSAAQVPTMSCVRLHLLAAITLHPDLVSDGSGQLCKDPRALTDTLRDDFVDHLDGLIKTVSTLSGLSKRALWRVAGDSLGQIFLETGKKLQAEALARAYGLRTLKRRGSAAYNHRFEYIDIIAESDTGSGKVIKKSFCLRGGCCRYFCVEGGGFCSNCPMMQAEEIRERLTLRLQMQLRQAEVLGRAR